MSDPVNLIICEYCDSVYHRPILSRFQKAQCQRCGAVIARHHWLSIDQCLALSVTAGLLMAYLSVYPILLIHVQGQTQSATLLESALALAQGPVSLMAVAVACAVLLVPALQISLLVWVLTYARYRRRAPYFNHCMQALNRLRHWSMLEVFLLGALVSVIKLSGRLQVVPTAGLFALAALSVLIIGLAGRDLRRLWNEVP
ncbi:paraquat-inducible protein A [Marinobacter caseinilyticus]|uniref:paraquat-inducible protein A n=1 Tax=Marinobacter caseinilyticus TaxID=2692195 RepID=UPI001407825C|nr:paraquat-inducible protein A [Marinobacter caseinilyticus]